MSRLVVLIAISLINVHKSIPKGRHFLKKKKKEAILVFEVYYCEKLSK